MMTITTIFQEIDRLHSEWSRMEKAARLGWLSGEKVRLTGLANQFSLYIYAKGGLMSDSNRKRPIAIRYVWKNSGHQVGG